MWEYILLEGQIQSSSGSDPITKSSSGVSSEADESSSVALDEAYDDPSGTTGIILSGELWSFLASLCGFSGAFACVMTCSLPTVEQQRFPIWKITADIVITGEMHLRTPAIPEDFHFVLLPRLRYRYKVKRAQCFQKSPRKVRKKSLKVIDFNEFERNPVKTRLRVTKTFLKLKFHWATAWWRIKT